MKKANSLSRALYILRCSQLRSLQTTNDGEKKFMMGIEAEAKSRATVLESYGFKGIPERMMMFAVIAIILMQLLHVREQSNVCYSICDVKKDCNRFETH